MKQLPCVCGISIHGKVTGEKDGRKAITCPACGIIRMEGYDDDYPAIYLNGDFYHDAQQHKDGHPAYRDRYQQDFSLGSGRVRKLLGRLRVLDVGCASGAFVDAAAKAGFDAYGMELNPSMAAWARQTTGRTIFGSWAEAASVCFDVVTYHDVFEHLVDPVAETRILNCRLVPNGLLILDLPDADEIFGPAPRAAHHFRPEQHLWYWNESSIRGFLESSGLRVIDVDRPIVGKIVVYARRW